MKLLNALSPLLQVLLDSLDFLLKSGRRSYQFGRLVRILGTREVNLTPEFGGGLRQFPHGLLSLPDFVNRTFHIASAPAPDKHHLTPAAKLFFMHALLRSTAHRPWPLPSGPWIMKQTWHDLLFAHWPLPAEQVKALIPVELPLDTYDGHAWIGVVPFRMSGIRAHGFPPLPGLSRFPELNVRTYVTYGGKPGVYFLSLDAANTPAVWAARRFFHLPYFSAVMSSREHNGMIHYSSLRSGDAAEFRGTYKPVGPVRQSEKNSLERFLTERYCLYTVHNDYVYRCDIHHLPWPLQDAEARLDRNTMASAAGIQLPSLAPVLHFARRLEVLIWPLRRAEETNPRV